MVSVGGWYRGVPPSVGDGLCRRWGDNAYYLFASVSVPDKKGIRICTKNAYAYLYSITVVIPNEREGSF